MQLAQRRCLLAKLLRKNFLFTGRGELSLESLELIIFKVFLVLCTVQCLNVMSFGCRVSLTKCLNYMVFSHSESSFHHSKEYIVVETSLRNILLIYTFFVENRVGTCVTA